jgi:hypothetical protein
MNHFTSLLKTINDRLPLPQPAKSRILLEIAADLHDTREYYLRNGLPEGEAVTKAVEKFDLTDNAIAELVVIHQSYLRKLLDRIKWETRSRCERLVLALVILTVLAVGARPVFSTGFILQASVFVWPVLLVFAGVAAVSLLKSYQLYIKKDHHIKRLHQGLPVLLLLGGANLFIGLFGYVYEIFAARAMTLYSGFFAVIVTAVKGGDELFFRSVECVSRCASMAMLCALGTLVTALIWFTLAIKVKKIEAAEAAFLLGE